MRIEMIRDKETASAALQQMENGHKLLMDSLHFVKANCPSDEYKAYRAGMSQVLGQLFFLVMEPIYRQHPSLAPSDTPQEFVKKWTKAPEKRKPEPDGT
jgi:hypothetical protein